MIAGLAKFLRSRKSKIVRRVVIENRNGDGEFTGGEWHEFVERQEVDMVDFDALMREIESFERTMSGRSAEPLVIDVPVTSQPAIPRPDRRPDPRSSAPHDPFVL